MANRHAAIGNSSGGGGRSMRDEDFDEEDVWAVVKDREDSSPIMRKSKDYSSGSSSSSSSSAWRLPTAPRGIRRGNNTPSHEAKLVQHSSAPMNIPDWSKIYRRTQGLCHGLMVWKMSMMLATLIKYVLLMMMMMMMEMMT